MGKHAWLSRNERGCSLLQIGGQGIFTWHSGLLPWYYRLGGAKIGKGVVIHPKAVMTDFDLITIGEGACIDEALVSSISNFDSKFLFQTC